MEESVNMPPHIEIGEYEYGRIEALSSMIDDLNNKRNVCKDCLHCSRCNGVSEEKIINCLDWYSIPSMGLELRLNRTSVIYRGDMYIGESKNRTTYELVVECDKEQYQKNLMYFSGKKKLLKIDKWV